MRRNRFDGGRDTKDINMGNNSPSKIRKDTNMGNNSSPKIRKDTNIKKKKFVDVDYKDYMVNGVLDEQAYGKALIKANPDLYPKSNTKKSKYRR